MTAAGTASAGRRAAASLMVDACTVVRPATGEPTLNETTGALTYGQGTEVYAGKCRVKPDMAPARPADAEERVVVLRQWVVSLPVMADWDTATAAEVDDVVTITACPGDPSLVGRSMVVASVVRGSTVTARRLLCTEQAS